MNEIQLLKQCCSATDLANARRSVMWSEPKLFAKSKYSWLQCSLHFHMSCVKFFLMDTVRIIQLVTPGIIQTGKSWNKPFYLHKMLPTFCLWYWDGSEFYMKISTFSGLEVFVCPVKFVSKSMSYYLLIATMKCASNLTPRENLL